MKRIFIAGLLVTGISLIITSLGAWFAPDLVESLPGGVVALFATVFIAISGLFGGKLTEWADTIFGKKPDGIRSITTNNIDQQVKVDQMSGGVIAKEYHHHEAQKPEIENHTMTPSVSSHPQRQRHTSIAVRSKMMLLHLSVKVAKGQLLACMPQVDLARQNWQNKPPRS